MMQEILKSYEGKLWSSRKKTVSEFEEVVCRKIWSVLRLSEKNMNMITSFYKESWNPNCQSLFKIIWKSCKTEDCFKISSKIIYESYENAHFDKFFEDFIWHQYNHHDNNVPIIENIFKDVEICKVISKKCLICEIILKDEKLSEYYMTLSLTVGNENIFSHLKEHHQENVEKFFVKFLAERKDLTKILGPQSKLDKKLLAIIEKHISTVKSNFSHAEMSALVRLDNESITRNVLENVMEKDLAKLSKDLEYCLLKKMKNSFKVLVKHPDIITKAFAPKGEILIQARDQEPKNDLIIQLVKDCPHILKKYPSFFNTTLEKVKQYGSLVKAIFEEIPDDILSHMIRNFKDNNGNTVFHKLAKEEQTEHLSILIQRKTLANQLLSQKNHSNETVLHLIQSYQLVNLILEKCEGNPCLAVQEDNKGRLPIQCNTSFQDLLCKKTGCIKGQISAMMENKQITDDLEKENPAGGKWLKVFQKEDMPTIQLAMKNNMRKIASLVLKSRGNNQKNTENAIKEAVKECNVDHLNFYHENAKDYFRKTSIDDSLIVEFIRKANQQKTSALICLQFQNLIQQDDALEALKLNLKFSNGSLDDNFQSLLKLNNQCLSEEVLKLSKSETKKKFGTEILAWCLNKQKHGSAIPLLHEMDIEMPKPEKIGWNIFRKVCTVWQRLLDNNS